MHKRFLLMYLGQTPACANPLKYAKLLYDTVKYMAIFKTGNGESGNPGIRESRNQGIGELSN